MPWTWKCLEPIQEFRIKCVEDGQTVPALDKVIDSLRKQGTMVPGRQGQAGRLGDGLNLKDATKEKVDVSLSCRLPDQLRQGYAEAGQGTAKILQKAGVNFGIAGDAETCCGGRAYQMGYKEDFLNQAKKNMDLIKKAGAKTLVTGCADGYQAFKVLYDKFDLKGDLEVLHIYRILDQLIKEGKLKPRKKVDL